MSFSSPLAWYWVVAPLAVAVLALALLLRAVFHLAHGRFGHGGLHAAGGTVLAALSIGLVVVNTQSFARLTRERDVADVTVAFVGPAEKPYQVTVHRLGGSNVTEGCRLAGDEWLLSARVQRWKPWATILGMDATYTLDQIANKYASARAGNGKMITACDLGLPEPEADTWLPPAWLDWLLAQAYAEEPFGSAVYMPLADGAIYHVTMTQNGLAATAVNAIARGAVLRSL